jgi:hypothetical protein
MKIPGNGQSTNSITAVESGNPSTRCVVPEETSLA